MVTNSARSNLDANMGVAAGGLDPHDWPAFRTLAHTMLDEALGLVQGVGERPVWTPVPARVKAELAAPLPAEPQGASQAAADAARLILPYATGNIHPRFFGWVHGSGTAGGIIAEMLAAAMNANAGGRDHGAIYVERQVIDWCRDLFGFPAGASGLLVSGTSMATIIALTVARNTALGPEARKLGMGACQQPLVAYASSEAHSSAARAMELLGLGSAALRIIPADAEFRLDPVALRRAIAADKARGCRPFAVIASAGTVNTGAIDPIGCIADLCRDEEIWLHVDGAFGAMAMLSPALSRRLDGIERADSLAFDFHKWLHVPYDAGCVLVRDGAAHRAAFASRPSYLASQARGLAGGEPWPCDFGPELSRGFRALKVWFTLKEHGTRKLGACVEDNCRLAARLGSLVAADPALELSCPVTLNIACLRYRATNLSPEAQDRFNEDIVSDLQERGIAAPSTTRIGGRLVIRVNITNHRTRDADIDMLLDAIKESGASLLPSRGQASAPIRETHLDTVAAPLAPDGLVVLDMALARPEIATVCQGLALSIRSASGPLFHVPRPGVLILSAKALQNHAAAAVLIRHGAELARMPAASTAAVAAAHGLLAGRTAGCYLAMLPRAEQLAAQAGLPEELVRAYAELSKPLLPADIAGLAARHSTTLEDMLGFTNAEPADRNAIANATGLRIAAVNQFAALMALAPPAEYLLTHGGDARITPSQATGRNGYGSSARPTLGEIGFSSSTATCISPGAYESVDMLRRQLMAGCTRFDIEIERLRAGVLARSGAIAAQGSDAILTASGTDAELAAVALALAYNDHPLTSIVISPEETGSGVPLATLGRNFSTETALGAKVAPGADIDGFCTGRVISVSIAIRNANGSARPLAEVGKDVAAATAQAVGTGRRVLLHVLDAAKTGIGAPALGDVVALTQRYGDAVDVVVDACQARLGPEAVAAYLGHGWMVQITGSKFWGGPPFSGALLVPPRFTQRTPNLAPLGAYMARQDWPPAMAARAALPDSENLGLLCRWQAALFEAERFAVVTPGAAAQLTCTYMAIVATALATYPELLPLDGLPIDHEPICDADSWKDLRSIVPFVATRAGMPLTLDEAKLLHQGLARDSSGKLERSGLTAAERQLAATPCHLGQPVKLGTVAGGTTGALRICASMRTLLAIGQPGGAAAIARDLATVLAKTRLLLSHLDALKA